MFRLINKSDSCKFYKKHVEERISKFNSSYILLSRLKSYYHALELNSDASEKDIKTAYYKLSLLYHPDKNSGSEESVVKFREITEAYEILSNPEKKKKYDEGCNFQSQYSQSYRRTENFYRSTSYQGPYAGKTKDYDYEKHFKNHYQDFQKQRDAEYEYFKRRWEAEFYRRYPTLEHYYRNRHKHTESVNSEHIKNRLKEKKRQIYSILGLWGLLIMLTLYGEFYNPERRYAPHPIYYNSKSKNELEDVDITENKPKRDL